MKKRRQAKLLEIIKNYDIKTQDDLQQKLSEFGFEVTQATISRDIRELGLVKEFSKSGKYVYSEGKRAFGEGARFTNLFDSIVGVDVALNIACVKCFPGTANAACAAIDAMQWDGVVGTIAGDDTIFVLCKSEEAAEAFSVKLEKSINA